MKRIAVVAAVTALTAGATLGVSAPATAHPGKHAHPWDAYNLAPASRTVTPQQVFRTTGTVHSASGVLRSKPTSLVGSGASITLDFGQEVGGLVSVHFPASTSPGQRLGLAFSESSQYIGPTSDASNGGSGADGAIDADVTPGTTWTMPAASLRGGFRYLTLFADSAGTIAVDHVSLAITFAPSMSNLRDYDNYFYSSDPLLNKIWYAGAYTVQTNTIAPTTGRVWGPPASGWDNSGTVGVGDEVLVDGAKRDRTVWPGDLGVSVPTEFTSLGDMTPTRNALTTLYNHQSSSGELPFAGPEVNFYGSDTYHLWTLIGTANYYQDTHDNTWLSSEWANYVRAVQFSLAKVGSDGLLNVTGTADWARSDQGGENIEANALLYQALVTGAELATVRHDATDAATWSAVAVKLKTAANDILWDDGAGQYRDNPSSALHPQDGNSAAVWYGLAPADRAARISAALTTNWNSYGATTPENGGQISTFPGSMEVQAHLAAGDSTRALELIRREWGYMLKSPLGTGSTFWEGYLANGQFGYGGAYMSAAHGWSTGPTSALTFYVLGIAPTTVAGGYAIHPEPGDLSSTQGSLKTPLGDITLSWRHDVRTRTFTEQVAAPAGAVAHVDVPTFGAKTAVVVNGRLAWDGHRSRAYGAHLENGYVVLAGTPRKATVVSQAVGSVATTLDVAVTSSTDTPVLAGQSLSIPVTVSASGDRVVSGTVTAQVPSGWTVTPAPFSIDTRNGSSNTVVNIAVKPPAGTSGGADSVAITASGGGRSASTTAPVLVFGTWPTGTSAVASSFHAPNIFNGQTRTYDPGNAIDADLATFWNDDTGGAFPDSLTVTTPAPVSLAGVGFASLVDGVPTDFTVQSWDGTQWVNQATVAGSSALYRWIPFATTVSTTQVRIVVTASQTQNGNFTRIAELTP
jgi:Bacterial alpha-L-rhamnosidase 6 hairpin glycosidase domain